MSLFQNSFVSVFKSKPKRRGLWWASHHSLNFNSWQKNLCLSGWRMLCSSKMLFDGRVLVFKNFRSVSNQYWVNHVTLCVYILIELVISFFKKSLDFGGKWNPKTSIIYGSGSCLFLWIRNRYLSRLYKLWASLSPCTHLHVWPVSAVKVRSQDDRLGTNRTITFTTKTVDSRQ